MSRTLRPRAVLAMVAMAAVISAACGGSGSNGGTASNTGTGSGDNSTASTHTKAVRFAECMRENGVRDFPDPNASGELTIDAVANGSSVDTDSPAFEQALGACKDLQPSGFTGHERSAEEQAAALRFAQCIRENGVKDFPDPGPDQPLVDTNRIPSTATEAGMSILNAAMYKCGDFGAAAGATGGQ